MILHRLMDFVLEKKAAPFHMMLMMFWIENGKQENQRDKKGKENKKAQVMDVCVHVCVHNSSFSVNMKHKVKKDTHIKR